MRKIALVRNPGKAVYHVRAGEGPNDKALCGEASKRPGFWYITMHRDPFDLMVRPAWEDGTIHDTCREKLADELMREANA